MNQNLAALLYLVSGVLFILALRGLSSPVSSRRGNMFGMIGMAIAILTTISSHVPAGIGAWVLVVVGLGIGGGIGAVIARRVPMTMMPELVAAFHSLVGMAAVLVAAGALYAPSAFDIGTVGHIHGASLIEMARAMVDAGHATSPRDAFARHLYDNGPVDVAHRTLPIADALAAGRAANAAMALAHPHLYNDFATTLIRRHHGDGLTGIEAFYGVYDMAQRRRWIGVADELGAVCTGGSDWHGPEKAGDMCSTGMDVGVDLPAKRVDALLRWLT